MRVAITGHTSGIGFHIAEVLQKDGNEVVGFSRSQGWDISDPVTQDLIVQNVVEGDFDVFINNAHYKYAQSEILAKLHPYWEGKKKTIVNIGSSITMRWDTKNKDPQYRNEKLAIDDASEYYWNKSPWPRVMIYKPCATDTNRMSHWNGPKECPSDIARFLVMCLRTPLRIQQIGISIDPAD
jgi:hypothetical protein